MLSKLMTIMALAIAIAPAATPCGDNDEGRTAREQETAVPA